MFGSGASGPPWNTVSGSTGGVAIGVGVLVVGKWFWGVVENSYQLAGAWELKYSCSMVFTSCTWCSSNKVHATCGKNMYKHIALSTDTPST
jgi:hypothetical protein